MDRKAQGRHRQDEQGFALILALLSLLLLTFLGLSLALTTSTEVQIAANYRWSQQAYYNAQAGVEFAKHYLRDIEFRALLPLPRASGSAMSNPPPAPLTKPGPEGEPSRNFELWQCDTRGRVGFGVVLDDPGQPFSFQNSGRALGQQIQGTFTLWVRRPVITAGELSGGAPDPSALMDDPRDTSMILTAEGAAPYGQGGTASNRALSNRAVRYIEVMFSRLEGGGACYDPSCGTGSR